MKKRSNPRQGSCRSVENLGEWKSVAYLGVKSGPLIGGPVSGNKWGLFSQVNQVIQAKSDCLLAGAKIPLGAVFSDLLGYLAYLAWITWLGRSPDLRVVRKLVGHLTCLLIT